VEEALAPERADQPAARAKRPPVLAVVLAYLAEPKRAERVCLDLIGGLGLGFVAWGIAYPWSSTREQVLVILFGFLPALAAALFLVVYAYSALTGTIRRALKVGPRLSRWQRIAAVVMTLAAAWVIIAAGGTVLAAIVAAVLPAAFVACCGLWACLFTLPWARTTAHRWLRSAQNVIAIATTALALLLLTNHALLTTEPTAGLVFPLAVWGSVKVWRAMNASERVMIKAGADLTLSLLLGTGLVLLLVWLANLLDLPRHDMAALRALLADIGSAADLPWWAWAGLYLLLAGVSLAFLLRPARLATVMRWLRRLRVAAATDVTRRMLTGLHIGLLVIVFAGLATPVALAPVFQRQAKAVYTVALQRQFQARGDQAVYAMIVRQFRKPARNNALAGMVTKINDISAPSPGGPSVTGTETDLANHLGAMQAAALHLPETSLVPAEQHASRRAGLDAPVQDASDLSTRLSEVAAQQARATEAEEAADQAGELAARTVASLISIPGISGNEVFQIVREYLSGLVEDSGVKDWFAAWAEHLAGGNAPDAETVVVPDPGPLEKVALATLSAEFTGDGLPDPVTDPFAADPSATDPALLAALRESPLDAAVDLVNQARYLQQDTGPCGSCFSRVGGDDNPGEEGPGDDGGGGDGGDGGGDGGGGGGGGGE
jgi:hypothetical protein